MRAFHFAIHLNWRIRFHVFEFTIAVHFSLSRKPNANTCSTHSAYTTYTHNDRHFCRRHNGNGPSLCVHVCLAVSTEHASVLQLCWHVSHLCHQCFVAPTIQLDKSVNDTHSLTLRYTLFALEQLFATHQPCHWNRTESNWDEQI